MRGATVEIHKEELSFSAGHFTIFSATDRENMHGHNYYVGAKFEVLIDDNGLAFDYRVYRNKLRVLCDQLDRRFLLPACSRYLKIEEQDKLVIAHFNNEPIPFLKRDVLVMPICNITIEELSHWFLQQLLNEPEELKKYHIQDISVQVSNGPGHSGASCGKVG